MSNLIKKFCILTVVIVMGFTNAAAQNLRQDSSDTKQQLALFESVYHKVLSSYVEEVDVEKMIRAALDSMLLLLDPHSQFFNAEEAADFELQLSGVFGGVGLAFRNAGDYFLIVEVFENMPAQKSGLHIADTIVAINGQSIKGYEDIYSLLRGEVGTNVSIGIKRPGFDNAFAYTIERAEIKMRAVPYYGFVQDDIGYIRLVSESKQSAEEVKDALIQLKKQQILKGVILDLRDNIGGYMKEANTIANLFLDPGKLLLRIHGKERDTSYYTDNQPWDSKIPLVLLVNNWTASSAEILTGALQDQDRAVIIGQTTYGKGLINEMFDLENECKLKLTTAYFYTPGGRCIQAQDYQGFTNLKSDWVSASDTIRTRYATANGRLVYSYGGIVPDIKTIPVETDPLIRSLFESNLVFDFATQYKKMHGSIPEAKDFYISDKDFQDFKSLLEENNFTYQHPIDAKMGELEKLLDAQMDWQHIKPSFDKLQKEIELGKANVLASHRDKIKQLLEEEIASRYYYGKGKIAASLKNDQEVIMAVQILGPGNAYAKLLSNPK